MDSIFNVGDEATFEDEFSLFISLCFDVCFILLQETIEIVGRRKERKGKEIEARRGRSARCQMIRMIDDRAEKKEYN